MMSDDWDIHGFTADSATAIWSVGVTGAKAAVSYLTRTMGDTDAAAILLRRGQQLEVEAGNIGPYLLVDMTAPPARVEWAAETIHADGTVKRRLVDDEEFAEFTTDSIAAHLASLNEPTRAATGITAVNVVNREVRELSDGTQIISPWRVVRAGSPQVEADRG